MSDSNSYVTSIEGHRVRVTFHPKTGYFSTTLIGKGDRTLAGPSGRSAHEAEQKMRELLRRSHAKNDPAKRRRKAVRIPKAKRASTSERVRRLVAEGYSPRYAAEKAYGRRDTARKEWEVVRKGYGAPRVLAWFATRAEAERERRKREREALQEFKEGRIMYDLPEYVVQRGRSERDCARDCVGIHTHESLAGHAAHHMRDPAKTEEIGPYSEYSPAHERAMKEQARGLRNIRIVKERGGWVIRGVRSKAHARDPSRLTAAGRRHLRATQFALPARRALPLDTPARIRSAASRLAGMRKRGTVDEHEYREALRRVRRAEARHGIHHRTHRGGR